MVDFDALIKQSENDQQAITKPAIPEVRGTRRPILVYVGESKHPFTGHIVESPHLTKIIHEFKVQSYTVTHVARLVPSGESLTIRTEFSHVKQNPSLNVSFFGTLTKTKSGYSGAVTVSSPSLESTQTWDVEYDD